MSASDDDVAARTAALYGTPLPRADGVVHVVAVARERDAPLRVMRIGPAPTSPTDAFVLGLTRARVDAILITGSILRAEPELRYELDAPLAAHRRALGFDRPPLVVVLTRGRDLDPTHPVLRGDALVLCPLGAVERLALPAHVERYALDDLDAREAIRWMREERGCTSVSVEAGPNVAVPLYDPPLLVDELVLSVFEGPLVDEARGGAFLDEESLARRMRLAGGPTRVDEPSGPWTFSRWLRPERS